VNAVIPPLAIDGACLTIRKFSADPYGADDLISFGTLTGQTVELLDACVRGRMNILVSGGTGAGKTTTLNVLSSLLPDDERILTIEDSAELRLQQPHVVRLEYRPPNIEGRGEVTIRDLVRNALRMRPDRIVVGEVRGGEALDMMQAMNTGHDGSMTTVHANNARDALGRIEVMIAMAGFDLPIKGLRTQISSAINIIVQARRITGGKRKVVSVSEITGMEGDLIQMHDLFTFEQRGVGFPRVSGARVDIGALEADTISIAANRPAPRTPILGPPRPGLSAARFGPRVRCSAGCRFSR